MFFFIVFVIMCIILQSTLLVCTNIRSVLIFTWYAINFHTSVTFVPGIVVSYSQNVVFTDYSLAHSLTRIRKQ